MRSNILPILRRTIDSIEQLKLLIEPIAEFRLVVDANILISDVMWALEKRQKPEAKSSLQECIQAGTVIAFVTTTVVQEVERHLPRLTADRGLSHNAWVAEWAAYKAMLQIVTPEDYMIEPYLSGRDPDDAPTLALAKMLSASGVLTHDLDIAAMGGTAIPIEFILKTREYSRKTAITVSIRVGGLLVVMGAVEALAILISTLKQSAGWFQRLPDNAKSLALVVAICVVLHPTARRSILTWLEASSSLLASKAPELLRVLIALCKLTSENQACSPIPPCQAPTG